MTKMRDQQSWPNAPTANTVGAFFCVALIMFAIYGFVFSPLEWNQYRLGDTVNWHMANTSGYALTYLRYHTLYPG